jgi:hypothetical protein
MNVAGDIEITVGKPALLEKLRSNRDSHRGLYEKAYEGYRKAMLADLEAKLTDLKAGKAVDPYLRHQAPEDHTRDYDDVVDMLEMHQGDTLELTQAQFRCYVKDDWGWKKTWTTSNSAYIGS